MPCIMSEVSRKTCDASEVSSRRSSKSAHGKPKAEFLCNVAKFNAQQNFLEKSQPTIFKSMDQQFHNEINAYRLDLESQRNEELGHLQDMFLNLKTSLNQLKSDVDDEESLRRYGLDHYRKAAYTVQDKISSCKDYSFKRLQELEEDEQKLTNEIKVVKNKLEEWSKHASSISQPQKKRTIPRSRSQDSGTVAPEVKHFTDFVYEHGGHNGGWEDADHIMFLQFRRKHRAQPEFLTDLAHMLPHMTPSQLQQHEEWYRQYLVLKEHHLKAIGDWRQKKVREKKKPELPPQIQLDNEAKQQKEAAEKQSLQIKMKLEEWKKEKELKKELEELQKLEEKQKQLELERKKAMKQARMKADVEQYKMEKLNQEQAAILSKQMQELKEIERRAAEANMLIKAFRKQDDDFLARQKALREAKEKKLLEESRFCECPPFLEVERDPQRLLRATEVWKGHCKKPEPEIKPILHLRNMPKLGIPQWRKGLNRF